eukprot:SAG22_NODE_907_length_6555_cov_19.560099_4_plen_137_part_00
MQQTDSQSLAAVSCLQVWQSDETTANCRCCETKFSLFNRRHHCRVCGLIYCSDCLLRSCPYFEPLPLAPTANEDYHGSLAVTVADEAPTGPVCPGKLRHADVLTCHDCFAVLQLAAVAQRGSDESGLRFAMVHAGT